MSGAGAVLLREVEERWQILLGSLLIGLLALLAPQMPHGIDRNLQGDFALMLGGIVSCIVATVLGPAVIGRELAERRLSFFFSRPLSGAAIWSGKLAGVVVLAVLCGAVSALPGGLVHALRRDPVPDALSFSSFLSWGLWLILLLLCTHTAGVLLRERSAWLLLDFAALFVVLVGLTNAGSGPGRAGAGEAFKQVWAPALVLIAVSLAVASAVQVIKGRSDLSRGRRFLSWTLWPLLLLVTLGVNGFARWVLSPRLQDLVVVDRVAAAPSGDWVYVAGPVAGRPGYRPGFVINTRSGRFERLHQSTRSSMPEPLAFSGDGLHLAFLRSPAESSGWELFTFDLNRSGAQPQSLGVIPMQGSIPILQFSRDGRFLAVLSQGQAVVRDLRDNRLVAAISTTDPQRYNPAARFVDASHLRVVTSGCGNWVPPVGSCWITIQNLDLTTGQALPERKLQSVSPFFSVSPDGSRILAATDQGILSLYNAATGEKMADLAAASTLGDDRGQVLPDGRLVVTAHYRPAGQEIWIFAADGSGPPERHPFPGVAELRIAGQPSPGKLIVTTDPGSQVWLLDLRTDQRQKIGEGMVPIRPQFDVAIPEGAVAGLFQRGTYLLDIDPATGRERAVTGPPEEAR